MKTKQLTKEDRKEITFFQILFIACIIALSLITQLAFGQEAIKLQPRAKSHETFKNVQGFALPSTVPDTTRVYQIGEKGSKFYFRRSSNTGKLYKVYLKKDSISMVPETSNK